MQKKIWSARTTLAGTGLSAAMLVPTLSGCGGAQPEQQQVMPPQGAMQQRPMQRPAMQQQRPGMTGKQKMMLVAGAAALYYIYKKRQTAKAQGPNGQYFQSKNGRVYYRDLKTGAFQYVSPPTQPVQISEAEAQQYGLQGYQGYPGATSGREFGGYGATSQGSYTDAVPAPAGAY